MSNTTTITAKTDTTRAMLILAASVFGGRVTEVPPQEPVEVSGEDYFMNISANVASAAARERSTQI